MTMKVTLSELRRMIREAVVDNVRLPRGANSRDDSDDRSLGDPVPDRLNIDGRSLNIESEQITV